MISKKLLLLFSLFTFGGLIAQEANGPTSVVTGSFLGETIPLRNATIHDPGDTGINELTIVPNGYEGTYETLVEGRSLSNNIQKNFGPLRAVGIDQNFDGASSNESGFVPPDPTGAVGPNHYVHSVNSIVKIFDKQGVLLAGPTTLGNFLGNGTNSGDPIVMYDQLADRYFVSQFGTATNSLVLGVSTTNDPTGTYYVYEYIFGAFPDYPHYSVWPDGYYLSINEGGGGPNNNRSVYVMDREAMIAGEANPQMAEFVLPNLISNPTNIFNSGPAHLTGLQFPADTPGFISYLQDDVWDNSITQDHLKVWEIDLDWDNMGNSTISTPQEIPLDNFDTIFAPFGTGDIDQPGTSQDLAGQGGIISYASNYRSFDDHNSWLITFNTDVDGNNTSGVRWIELRNTAADTQWSVYQEGTYAPSDGNSRFMSSGGIDSRGNIAIAYSVAGPNTPVGLSYTGRYEGDTLGELTVAETEIVAGVGVQTYTHRYGDYAHLTMDPDDLTFWFTSQYFQSTNTWTSRVTSFKLAEDFNTDLAVVAINTPNDGILTNSEVVEIEVRNYGTDDQSNFPIELYLDNTLVATENYTGTLSAGDTSVYTFTQTVDLSTQSQTYLLRAETAIATDEFIDNNAFEKEVTHTFTNDVGVVAIDSPNDMEAIGLKTVTITVENLGINNQSTIDVQYTINGGTAVTGQITGVNLALGEQTTYSFTTEADLDSEGSYDIVASTNLSADQDNTNDAFTKVVTVEGACIPEALGGDNGEDGCLVHGIKQFQLGDINADNGANGCNTEPEDGPAGYADRTYLSTILSNLAGNNVYTLKARTNWNNGAGVEVLSAWIDFNDNSIFEASEQIIAGEAFEVVNALDEFEFTVPVGSALGEHTLRVKAINGNASGDINNPCSDYSYGETQDYTVVIDEILGTSDNQIKDSDLIVESLDNNHFDITLTTQLESNVYVALYNSIGQQLKYKKIQQEGNTFKLSLNMESASTGVYFVKLIAVDQNTFKTVRILVK
ncbi:hypothetical protein SCB49_02314 [unidentified eubacterium SCB49]|nr:hypothetical protein SCB49_02314 [unidentified eubacterium SCB49]